MSTSIRLLAPLALCAALTPSALASLQFRGFFTDVQYVGGTLSNVDLGSPTFYLDSARVSMEAHQSLLTLDMPASGGDGGAYSDFWLSFRTGEVPVAVYNQELAAFGKVVNAGGTITNPRTSLYQGGFLYELLDSNGDQTYNPGEGLATIQPYAWLPYPTYLTGNGWRVYNGFHAPDGVYVLAPHRTYVARLHQYIGVAADSGAPTVSVTNETFDISYSFEHMPVPEPGSLAALGLGLAALRRRRR